MGVVYRFYINPFYHVTKIAMGFTVYRRNSRNDYRDFPKCIIFAHGKQIYKETGSPYKETLCI